ncbi:MAG: class I SAM-dependent methyltransferase [Bacteroidetes bacterium]|nr:class I SAM-dependent methyltransferase [Bacteroidota bacterium]
MKYKDIIATCNPSQSHWELNQLLIGLDEIDIKNVLEIGIHRGGSLGVWKKIFNPKILIGVDNNLLPETREIFEDDFLVEGMSQDQSTVDRVKSILGENKIDFLFVDGGHLYKEILGDFKIYSNLVRPGGVIGFHDVVIKNNSLCEVYRFWNEIKRKYKTVTIWDGTPTGTGEGLLFL